MLGSHCLKRTKRDINNKLQQLLARPRPSSHGQLLLRGMQTPEHNFRSPFLVWGKEGGGLVPFTSHSCPRSKSCQQLQPLRNKEQGDDHRDEPGQRAAQIADSFTRGPKGTHLVGERRRARIAQVPRVKL